MIDPAVQSRLQPTLYRLEGVRCFRCHHADVSRRSTCARCGNAAVATVRFSGKGRLLAVTLMARPPSEHDRLGAFHLALVELDDGPRLLAKLTDVTSRPAAIGDAVEVVIRRLFEPGPEELICYGYKVRGTTPVTS